ncbi:MAG: SufD family Fe-S cluster assembly protein [Candidatus Izimaplasma sp.]|nr:SufD family Fe-S cluster assembly protein [Candidatus Izimaplasma bacterium]
MIKYNKPVLSNDTIFDKINTLSSKLSNVLIIKDGHILYKNLEDEYNDIYIKSYDEAMTDKADFFDQTKELYELDDDAYQYNLENVNSGLFIHVPKNKVVAEQLHIFYIQESVDLVQNTTIILDESSELKYFEYLYNEGQASINYVNNSFVKENAKLEYSGLSLFNKKAVINVTRNSSVARYGTSSIRIAEVNDSITETKTNVYLQGKYAYAEAKTIAITSGVQSAKFRQLIEHQAPETEGYIENYGVSNHESALEFEGVGKINKFMKHSIARQSNNGIVLGKKAQLDANPLLLIDEFDVEASHGAAIGKIDEEQLYYLMSRGLSTRDAERLIISGFLSPVLEVLSSDELKEDFKNQVQNKTL